eukprot:TRINITY_DN1665_c2_g1_i1.p1 TRINITY_DN1665_c2_g1~~TRINITY_DN1665_c2_g1_i1.p1  ORF type:complete len:715 (+),score=268.01 TRINITY_DN1665_c2_g1_i1:52-2145(+)
MFGKMGDMMRGVVSTPKRKKSIAGKNGSPGSPDAFKFEVMENAMQEKLKMGVKYNMKVLIKGERGAGKSSLLKRLQGKPFEAEYTKTPQIQAATIHWHASTKEEAVKVEVWEVIDEGFRTQAMQDQCKKLQGQAGLLDAIPISDATNIDVYRDAHCVMFVLDATNPDALNYLKTELPKIPKSICVLVLRSKCDLDGVVITEEHIHKVVATHKPVSTPFLLNISHNKIDSAFCVAPQVVSTSMLNCYGLKQLYSYLNVPFEFLRTITIEAQLRKVWEGIALVQAGITEEASESYSDYCLWLESTSQSKQDVVEDIEVTESEVSEPVQPQQQQLQSPPMIEGKKEKKKGFKARFLGGKRKDSSPSSKSDKDAKETLKTETPQQDAPPLDFTGGKQETDLDGLDGFFGDLSDDDKAEDANRVASDIDSDDLTAGQLAWRNANTTTAQRTRKRNPSPSSEEEEQEEEQEKPTPDPEPEPEPVPIVKKETEEERAERKAAKKEAKKRAAEEKRQEDAAKREKEARERREWKEREEREKREREEEEQKKNQELADAAIDMGMPEDDGFFSEEEEEAKEQKEIPASEAVPEEEEEEEEVEQTQQTISEPPQEAPQEATPAPQGAEAVSAQALEALALAMSSMQQDVQEAEPLPKEKKEKKPKKDRSERDREKKEKRRRRDDGPSGEKKERRRRRREEEASNEGE